MKIKGLLSYSPLEGGSWNITADGVKYNLGRDIEVAEDGVAEAAGTDVLIEVEGDDVGGMSLGMSGRPFVANAMRVIGAGGAS
ncbi:MAG: hypothetical protein E6Q97_00175 [Desulfurellales bacterium]|nr:MAG: hypothetical protein E6Q97_00175 [Desulfurellales bacterium]